MARSKPSTDVLICGGGPVGLALAVELGWRGVGCVLVEQGDGAVTSPKANFVNVRTMEHCRRWGLAEAVRRAPFPDDFPQDVSFVTSMAGHELARLPRPAKRDQRTSPASPETGQTCSQHWFDPILRDAAGSFASVTLIHRCRLESFTATATEVRGQVRHLDTGDAREITASFLAGCDGGSGAIRRHLGISFHGTPVLGRPMNALLRAPGLIEFSGKAPALRFMIVGRDGIWANLRFIDPNQDIWRFALTDLPPAVEPGDIDLDNEFTRAVGGPISHEWISLFPWTRRSVVADRYQSGRVFLVGDAAHQLSPTGAYGMNTGIGDAVDLGWKLGATLAGWGGAALLASYDAERRPVGERNVDAAQANYDHWIAPPQYGALEEDSAAGEERRRVVGAQLIESLKSEFSGQAVPLGYGYDASPICLPDGTPPYESLDRYVPSTRPGARAPHAWLADGRSTLDLFGRSFVLLRLGPDAPDAGPLIAAARHAGMPLEVVGIDDANVADLYESKLVLVRPDGHVAWRADEVPQGCAGIMETVRGVEPWSAAPHVT